METAVSRDWSGLHEELILIVMWALGIPDLLRAGAVCASCAGADDDDDTATIYSPATGAAFKVRLPPPAFRGRHVVGTAHGWVVTDDEASNLQALNPLTGAQVDLPLVTGLHHVEPCPDGRHGRPAYNLYEKELGPDTPSVCTARELRVFIYHRVFLSCSPSAGAGCVVLLMHKQRGEMSYARIGDGRWALITANETVPSGGGYGCAAYNDNDGMWYVELRTLTNPIWVPAEHAHEVWDPCSESYTYEMKLYKVDVGNQKCG
ncbi:uncharacterized protein [Setaria viridis]|uniref:uncharacterized protein n=1 Tax=Setaria viridis TaxID=4556 RepID=UPI0014935E95|nr:uncharacterized protein LOC117834508 [Setaria viridis]